MSLSEVAHAIGRAHAHAKACGIRTCFLMNGAVHASAWMLSVGGGSASVMETTTAYSSASLAEYLGRPPQGSSVSEGVAALAARRAFRRAMHLSSWQGTAINGLDPRKFVGVACTAALATDRARRGTNRCFVATYQPGRLALHKLFLPKGLRSREEEDKLATRLVLWAYSTAIDVPDREQLLAAVGLKLAPEWRDSDSQGTGLSTDTVFSRTTADTDPFDVVFAGTHPFVPFLPSGASTALASDSTTTASAAAGTSGHTTASAAVTSGAGAGAGAGASSAGVGAGAAASGAGVGAGAGATSAAAHAARDLVPVPDAPIPAGTIVCPGSFNPVHEGHVQGAAAAAAAVAAADGRSTLPSVLFELSIANADKPSIDKAEAERRVNQFAGVNVSVTDRGSLSAGVVVSNRPLFVDKAALYPGAVFCVGYDTAVRIVDRKYYGNSEAELVAALASIHRHGCRFAVLGRVEDGAFKTLKDMAARIPAGFASLFLPVDFRNDISSTAIRAGRQVSSAL